MSEPRPTSPERFTRTIEVQEYGPFECGLVAHAAMKHVDGGSPSARAAGAGAAGAAAAIEAAAPGATARSVFATAVAAGRLGVDKEEEEQQRAWDEVVWQNNNNV